MEISLTQKDIEDAKISNTDSGYILDELAYSAGKWTSNDMHEANMDYEPLEPYQYDFEKDLFGKIKTWKDLQDICSQIGYAGNLPSMFMLSKTELQAGAFIALNLSDIWTALLFLYTEKLKADRMDSISEAYNKALQSEVDDYYDDLYQIWLYGDRDSAGVIAEVGRYYTENAGTFDKVEHVFTFHLSENDEQDIRDDENMPETEPVTEAQAKAYLIDCIIANGNNRAAKDKQEREKRKAEYEKTREYKARQAEQAQAERIAKLKAMTK